MAMAFKELAVATEDTINLAVGPKSSPPAAKTQNDKLTAALHRLIKEVVDLKKKRGGGGGGGGGGGDIGGGGGGSCGCCGVVMDERGAVLQARRAAAVGVGAVDDERAPRHAARPGVELEGVPLGREGTKALSGLRHALEAAWVGVG